MKKILLALSLGILSVSQVSASENFVENYLMEKKVYDISNNVKFVNNKFYIKTPPVVKIEEVMSLIEKEVFPEHLTYVSYNRDFWKFEEVIENQILPSYKNIYEIKLLTYGSSFIIETSMKRLDYSNENLDVTNVDNDSLLNGELEDFTEFVVEKLQEGLVEPKKAFVEKLRIEEQKRRNEVGIKLEQRDKSVPADVIYNIDILNKDVHLQKAKSNEFGLEDIIREVSKKDEDLKNTVIKSHIIKKTKLENK